MDSLKPKITRGLTELFIIVEEKWDIEQDLMLEMVSEDSIYWNGWKIKVWLVSGCIITNDVVIIINTLFEK